MMRLNQMWGMEEKPAPEDIHKAQFIDLHEKESKQTTIPEPLIHDNLRQQLPSELIKGKPQELDTMINILL